MASEAIQVGWRIEGEFMTQFARDRLYEDNNLSKALEILENCLLSDEITDDERLVIMLKILNGDMEIVGTYPDSDYGLATVEDENKDDSLGILKHLSKMYEELKSLREENETLIRKLGFIRNSEEIPGYKWKQIKADYKQEWDESLFEDDEEPSSRFTNNQLDLIDRYNKTTPYKPKSESSFEQRSLLSTGDKMLDDYLQHSKEASEDDYGWLAPDGTYYPVEWGHHGGWATDYMEEHNLDTRENLSRHDGTSCRYSCGDALIYNFRWCLLHSTYQGTAYPHYSESKGLTKQQREFLYDYYMKRNLKDEAKKYFEYVD